MIRHRYSYHPLHSQQQSSSANTFSSLLLARKTKARCSSCCDSFFSSSSSSLSSSSSTVEEIQRRTSNDCAFNSLHKNDAFFPRDEKTKRIEFKTPSTPSRPKTTRRSSFLSSSSLAFVVVRPTNVVVKVVLRVLVRADDSLPERGKCRRNHHHYQNVSRGMAVHVVRDRTENEQSETVFFTPRSRGYFEREQQRFRSASKKCV